MPHRDPVERVLGLDMPDKLPYDPIFNPLPPLIEKPVSPYHHPDFRTADDFKPATGDGR